MSAIAQGQQFTYTASLYSRVTAGPDAIVDAVANYLSSQGYQVLNRKIDAGSVYQQFTNFLGSSGLNVAPFNVTLTIADNNSGDDSGTAQFICDQALQIQTGQPVSSSSITVIGGVATGEPGQTDVQDTGLGLPNPLASIPTWALVLIAIIVILVVAVIISPTAPARLAASFAG